MLGDHPGQDFFMGSYGNYRKKKKEPAVALVGFYPYPETNSNNKDIITFHYRAIAIAYRTSFQLVNSPEEIYLDERPIIIMEEIDNRTISLSDYQHPRDGIYIVGNSKYRYPSKYINNYRNRVHIEVLEDNEPIYGDQVISMIMYDRLCKGVR